MAEFMLTSIVPKSILFKLKFHSIQYLAHLTSKYYLRLYLVLANFTQNIFSTSPI